MEVLQPPEARAALARSAAALHRMYGAGPALGGDGDSSSDGGGDRRCQVNRR